MVVLFRCQKICATTKENCEERRQNKKHFAIETKTSEKRLMGISNDDVETTALDSRCILHSSHFLPNFLLDFVNQFFSILCWWSVSGEQRKAGKREKTKQT